MRQALSAALRRSLHRQPPGALRITSRMNHIGKAEEFERLAKEARDQTLKQHYKLLAVEYLGLAKYYCRRNSDGVSQLLPRLYRKKTGARRDRINRLRSRQRHALLAARSRLQPEAMATLLAP